MSLSGYFKRGAMVIRTAAELGHLVRDARMRHGLTQAQLAADVGASRKWIIDFEGGKRTAELSLVLRTLSALHLQVDVSAQAQRKVVRPSTDIDAIVAASRRPPK